MKIRGVIFDMDGTITEPYFDFAKIKKAAGIKDEGYLEHLQRAKGAERARLKAILEKFEEDGVAAAKLNRGARKVLAFLKKQGIPTALLTRNSRKSVAGVCERLNLKFDLVVTREDGPHKPAPDAIWRIAKTWGFEPKEVLMVGDYKWDVQCANNAGAPCVLLINGEGKPEWSKDADFVITKLTDMIGIIEGQGK